MKFVIAADCENGFVNYKLHFRVLRAICVATDGMQLPRIHGKVIRVRYIRETFVCGALFA